MTGEQHYDKWIANRRVAEPSCDLTDRVMNAVEGRDVGRKWYVRMADRINESRMACCAACLVALLAGSLPFLFVAYVAQSLVF